MCTLSCMFLTNNPINGFQFNLDLFLHAWFLSEQWYKCFITILWNKGISEMTDTTEHQKQRNELRSTNSPINIS